MVYRIFVEKKPGLAPEADALLSDIRGLLGIESVTAVRLFNRYDAEGISADLFGRAVGTVFSEPQLDEVYDELPVGDDAAVFAAEYLPGQFDMRAESAAQCIQLISCGEKPVIRTAKVYALYGSVSEEELAAVKHYVINPVESREAAQEKPESLHIACDIPHSVPVLTGFTALDEDGLARVLSDYSLAMDADDARFCRDFSRTEGRDPTLTELRMIDTYWSDHCRHTTFLTEIDSVVTDDPVIKAAYEDYLSTRRELGRTKPVTLMDIGTIGAKYLKSKGLLDKLDESEEINACTVKIKVTTEQGDEDWLLLFKNETHNHPTEIEPFGGAATCIGGAIRDPLSGRAYVYAAMRVTGAGDPTVPLSDTLPGKLPQRKIVTAAAAGYSSYGNQIGLATGQVDEIYHPGYVAKRMEIGAVIGAVPVSNVRRERPIPGDAVILIGGCTGRDGCGGATGSSKSHTEKSLSACGAEVQKGNAPEERKLQRLFRNPRASLMIKRCNDFGAGGVSVAVGELADGLKINLDAVPKKYEGLDGTELAISESQERMAVVVAKEDVNDFILLAESENLEATVIASVTEEPRLTMYWNGNTVVDIPREFLNSNGAPKHITVRPFPAVNIAADIPEGGFVKNLISVAGNLNVCSRRGLSERFDSTIGSGTVLMPFGGKNQLTPPQATVNLIPLEHGHTSTCSYMAWGFNPEISEQSPYHGAYLAVVESVSKLIASGAEFSDVYLTFQEYFEKPMKDPSRWGKPFSALLGALRAQKELGTAAVGGKDSMSGSFENIDVPPTLVSFAVTTGKADEAVSPEFKRAGNRVVHLMPEYGSDGLPNADSLKKLYSQVTGLLRSGKAVSAWTPVGGGTAEAVIKMAVGNGFGFDFDPAYPDLLLFGTSYGSFLLELSPEADSVGIPVGTVSDTRSFTRGDEAVSLDEVQAVWEGRLESVYPCNIVQEKRDIPAFTHKAVTRVAPKIGISRPKVLIPVFPGTNCEYDTARVLEDAGAEPDIFIINSLSPRSVAESAESFAKKADSSQIIFIPGGFSGGDEPDGSGKFITAFFRGAEVKDSVMRLLNERDGLMCGICNGFQALIKLGLLPYGEIRDPDPDSPTLTFNTIGRHQSRLVRTRVCSNLSPFLSETEPGEIFTVPVSHGEGRFRASEEWINRLAAAGQIATQYVDDTGNPSCDVRFNPNDSTAAVEGITSPDGRVFGKMGHSERTGKYLCRNVPGIYDIGMFRAAVNYYRI